MSPDTDLEQIRKVVLPRLVRISIIQSVSILILIIGVVVLGYSGINKRPLTYGVSDTGRIIPLVPLDEPYVGDARVIGFADECVRQAFSHDFKNFRLTLAGAKDCFTTAGARGFDVAIEPLLADIQDKRMVMSVSLEPAVVVKVAKPRGVYTWVVQSRMTLFREGTKERVVPTVYTVDLVLERVPLEESVRGIGIAQINVRPGSAS